MVQPGYGVVIYTGPNRMIGTVTAYNKNTGVMSVNITSTEGSGTWSNWIVDVQIPAKPDYNKGEIFLWEGSAERFSGMAAGATSGSIILNNNVSAPGGNGINYVAILKGKGAGQYRRITGGWGSNVLQISEPWNILPDATSLVAIGPFNEKLALYKNELNADGKRYISENTNAAGFASTGVSLYGGCFNTYVSDNAMRGLRSAFISFSMQYTANGVSNPNLFNNFLRNDAIDCGWGMQVRSFHEWSDWSGGTMTAPGIIANIFRANRVVNSKHADASYYLPRSAYAGHPAVDGIVWEKNITTKGSLIGNTIKNWSRNEFGQAPVADKTAGTVAREIYYSNGSAN